MVSWIISVHKLWQFMGLGSGQFYQTFFSRKFRQDLLLIFKFHYLQQEENQLQEGAKYMQIGFQETCG